MGVAERGGFFRINGALAQLNDFVPFGWRRPPVALHCLSFAQEAQECFGIAAHFLEVYPKGGPAAKLSVLSLKVFHDEGQLFGFNVAFVQLVQNALARARVEALTGGCTPSLVQGVDWFTHDGKELLAGFAFGHFKSWRLIVFVPVTLPPFVPVRRQRTI